MPAIVHWHLSFSAVSARRTREGIAVCSHDEMQLTRSLTLRAPAAHLRRLRQNACPESGHFRPYTTRLAHSQFAVYRHSKL